MNPKTFVIVVDDDVSILDVLRQSLSMEGYTCEAFTRGEDALEALERMSAEVMLTDIVMPDLVNGLELAEQLRAEQPRLKVIVMSGYSAEATCNAKNGNQWGKNRFLEKPFPPAVLLRTLRSCLDEG